MAVNIQELFGSDFGNVEVQGGGVYFKAPGLYVPRLVKIKVDMSRAGFPYFLAEFDLVESSHPELPPGTRVTHINTLKNATYKDTFRAGVKSLVLALLQGQHPETKADQINDAVITAISSEQQPLTGFLLRAQASMIKTKAGNDFTKMLWTPYLPS